MGPKVKQQLIVVKRRRHRHPARESVNKVVRGGRAKWRDDPGGEGTQIVREARLCPRCAAGRAAT